MGLFPLPKVEVPRPSPSRSRRVQQRARRATAAAAMTNDAIDALNALHDNLPSSSMQTRNLPSHNVYSNTSIIRAVAHVQSCAERFVSRLVPAYAAPTSDDGFFGDTSEPFASSYSITTDALPLSAASVALPQEPGCVDILDVLPPEVARRYASPADLLRPVEERESAPAVRLVKSDADYAEIIRRMHDLGMVEYTTKPLVVNGLFGTPKSDGSQRLVFDGRAVNKVFVPSPKVELPAPDLLSKLSCAPDQEVVAAKADLDNYYHRLKVPSWMVPYFAMPAVRAGDVEMEHEYGSDVLLYPCCTTMPMGFSHAAYLAQVSHENLVDSRTSFSREDRITRTSDFLLDRPRHSIYIDDMILLALALASELVSEMLAEYIRVMGESMLPPKPSKTVWPSSDGVVCIGVEVHGKLLTVGCHPEKVYKLIRRTKALIEHGKCTGHELSKLVGHWSWAALARRPVFSVFNAVYRYIEVAGVRMFDLWPSVARELRAMSALAPLLFTSLGATWYPRTIATDASEFGQGVVAARADVDVVHAMSLAVVPPMITVDVDVPVLDRTLHPTLVGLDWVEIVASPWRYHEHINVLEMRALTTGLRWIGSFPDSGGSRLVVWSDSLVVVYAVRKGRSSSHPLLKCLRKLAAYVLATGIHVYCNWIPTEVNPADGPSRRYEFDSTLGFPGEGPGARTRNQTFLFQAAFAPATRHKYRTAVVAFLDWVVDVGEEFTDFDELDQLMVDYMHDLYIEKGGKCRSYAECAVSGLSSFMPSIKGKLPRACLALRGWRRLQPPVPHPPLTWDITVCIAYRMTATSGLRLGVATLLAFDCYLRIGELCSLRACDVADVDDPRTGSAHRRMALRLRRTKTGANQWVQVRNPEVQMLLRLVLGRVSSSRRRLFGAAPGTYRRWFKEACSSIGLSDDYVPHSLRHGGATHDHLAGVPLEEILQHGRWASTKSARHYIQAGRALLLKTSVPEMVLKASPKLVPRLLHYFSLSQ